MTTGHDRSAVCVGIDTSNYTTSICAIDGDGRIVFEERRVLRVPDGDRGLMQSAALFQHVANLPAQLASLSEALPASRMGTIGVSAKPRPGSESYMPVFLAGVLAARAMASGAGCALIETNHQAGHIAAGVATSGMPLQDGETFLALHLSGGTTDVLSVVKQDNDYRIETVATGHDLHVGQYVDRIGVALGLPFPCGKHLEALAETWTQTPAPVIPSRVKDGAPSFAGPLTAALRLLAADAPPAAVAAGVLRSIAAAVEKMLRYAFDQTGAEKALLVGGVASNQLIRTRVENRFGAARGRGAGLYFCAPPYASDNALGVALIARDTDRGSPGG
ncbi:MAG: O-sialoglycoprotein endopeptidase [Bacilli bacterium]